MKRQIRFSESIFFKMFFTGFSLCFLIAAVIMPDRAQMFSGLWQIVSQPAKICTNDFAVGGFAATFLNMGLVGLCFIILFICLGAKVNNTSAFAFLLTVGFSAWGINILNIWPTILGVVIYCLVKKEDLGANLNVMMFSTGIAPFISELLVRYPHAETVGFHPAGFLMAWLVGFLIGFLLPAMLPNAVHIHKGFDLYSAAVPVCFFAFFLNAFFYKTIGLALPSAPDAETLLVSSRLTVNVFCCTIFIVCILFALAMGCRPKDYWALLRSRRHISSISSQLGIPMFLMNVGAFGLFILAYYNLIGARFNAITFGIIFCMLCTSNSGSHPGNVWPIMLGYGLASAISYYLSDLAGGNFSEQIGVQSIAVGLCFANGLSPITSEYGWFWGMVAAMMHFFLVTTVPNMHGGYCLYNGGFTAAVVCLILIPQLEHFVPTREERAARRQKE